MRSFLLSLLTLAPLVFTSPIPELTIIPRDIRIIESSINELTQSLQSLAGAVANINRARNDAEGAQYAREIERTANEVTNSLRRGADRMRKAPKADIMEATRLTGDVTSLSTTTQTTVNAWIASKPVIVRSGGRETVLRILAEQEIATGLFTDSMVSRMPPTAAAVGTLFGQRSISLVKQATEAYRK